MKPQKYKVKIPNIKFNIINKEVKDEKTEKLHTH